MLNKITLCEFQIGEQIYVKLHPYVQQIAEARPYPKLAYKYFGPFSGGQQSGVSGLWIGSTTIQQSSSSVSRVSLEATNTKSYTSLHWSAIASGVGYNWNRSISHLGSSSGEKKRAILSVTSVDQVVLYAWDISYMGGPWHDQSSFSVGSSLGASFVNLNSLSPLPPFPPKLLFFSRNPQFPFVYVISGDFKSQVIPWWWLWCGGMVLLTICLPCSSRSLSRSSYPPNGNTMDLDLFWQMVQKGHDITGGFFYNVSWFIIVYGGTLDCGFSRFVSLWHMYLVRFLCSFP